MPRFGFYVDQVVCLDERGDIAIDELAAVIVHDPGFGILTRFERRLQLNGNRFAVKTHQQLVVHDIAAIRIDKAEQKLEASGNPNVHHVGMPLLIRCVGSEVVVATRGNGAFPAR